MSTSMDNAADAAGTYPAAVVFAIASFVVSLLIVPAIVWHAQHRNVGATAVTVLALVANLMNFCNALVWPNDDFDAWFNGVGLCDIEVKLQVVMQAAFPASLFCILRSLAAVLDVRRTMQHTTGARKRREFAVDLIICGGLPWLQALFAFIVQPLRYYVRGIAGCQPAVDDSWLAAVLMLVPRLSWTLLCAYFSVASMLTHHNTTKSRFLRLYALCVICILGMCPLEVYIDSISVASGLTPFSWTSTHDPIDYDWNSAVYVRSGGAILFDRYIWLAGGFVIFLTFGFGRDAKSVYRRLLRSVGMDRVGSRLFGGSRLESEIGNSTTRTMSSISQTIMSAIKTNKQKWFVKESEMDDLTTVASDCGSLGKDFEVSCAVKDASRA